MNALLSFLLAVLLAVGCGSSEAGGSGSAGAPAGGAGAEGGTPDQAGARTTSGAGGVERSGAGGQAAQSLGGAGDAGGAVDSGGTTQAGAGGFDSAGAAAAAPDLCAGKTCNGHGTCAGGVCSCETGYAAVSECSSCSAGYTGYPTCVTFPVCNTYENFFNGSVCRGCKVEDTTICTSDGAGHDLCFCAKTCPSNTCPSLQAVQGQCRSGGPDLCFLSCAIANGGTSTGCPTGFSCQVLAGGGDATCIQD